MFNIFTQLRILKTALGTLELMAVGMKAEVDKTQDNPEHDKECLNLVISYLRDANVVMTQLLGE
jgi:hypothetical protein